MDNNKYINLGMAGNDMKTTTIFANVPQPLKNRFKALAAAQGIKQEELLRIAMENLLNEHEGKKGDTGKENIIEE
jgi:hypothetical protein